MSKKLLRVLCLVLVCAATGNLTGCASTVQAKNLMEGIRANPLADKTVEDPFIRAQMELAVALFRSTAAADPEENVLISPLSIQLALAMTANGAAGQTREEMEALLGGGISLEDLNKNLHAYVAGLPSGEQYKLHIANSVWFRDDLEVVPDFLQQNADHYGAQIYQSPFDDQTRKDINLWVKEHTDGMIDKIVEQVDPNTVMYLVNALAFDARWQDVYEASDVRRGSFTDISGKTRTVKKMHSVESLYLEDEQVVGFVKAYSGGKYSFAVLLPKEGIHIRDYVAGLTGDNLLSTLRNTRYCDVDASLPKFQYEYSHSMNEILKTLGMPTAFDGNLADFSEMAHASDNLYIGNVLHKTSICVNEKGTRAGAATKVPMNKYGMEPSQPQKVVDLNRPFVYLILDNATNLPVFMGTVLEIPK